MHKIQCLRYKTRPYIELRGVYFVIKQIWDLGTTTEVVTEGSNKENKSAAIYLTRKGIFYLIKEILIHCRKSEN